MRPASSTCGSRACSPRLSRPTPGPSAAGYFDHRIDDLSEPRLTDYFTLYSLGLRLGEGLRLRVGDIDAECARVHIRDAKGNKDRFVPLPAATLAVLRRFWQTHRHTHSRRRDPPASGARLSRLRRRDEDRANADHADTPRK